MGAHDYPWVVVHPKPIANRRSATLLPSLRRLFVVCGAVIVLCGLTGAARQTETTKILNYSLDQCTLAITNAFETAGYHGMLLVKDDVQWDPRAKVWSRIPATNEWSIFPAELPVSLIRRRNGFPIPYDAEFVIRAKPLGTNRCKVTVLTATAWVPWGLEPNIHGGGCVTGAKEIQPLLGEETNVLLRLEKQLICVQNGDSSPLPPTYDEWELEHPGAGTTSFPLSTITNDDDTRFSRIPEPRHITSAYDTNGTLRMERRGQMPPPQIERLATALNLNGDQTAKLTTLWEDQAKQRSEIFSNPSLQREERQDKMRLLREECDKQLKVILTSEQFEKWLSLKKAPAAH